MRKERGRPKAGYVPVFGRPLSFPLIAPDGTSDGLLLVRRILGDIFADPVMRVQQFADRTVVVQLVDDQRDIFAHVGGYVP